MIDSLVLARLRTPAKKQARRWVGTRFPFISVGMILASALFIAIPSVVSLIPPTTVMRSLLPIDVLMVWIGLAIAIASIPAGIFAVKIGNSQAMLCGICAIIPSLLIMISVGAQIPIIILIVAGFSLIVNGAIPFALGLVPQRWMGLGIRMYFGGFAFAMSLFGVIFPQPQAITPLIGAVGGALAFLLAGLCIIVSGISETQKNAEV
jgi:hypothetical protein